MFIQKFFDREHFRAKLTDKFFLSFMQSFDVQFQIKISSKGLVAGAAGEWLKKKVFMKNNLSDKSLELETLTCLVDLNI